MAYATIQADNRQRCESCRKFGKNGANYRVLVNGRPMPHIFHRPCADEVATGAPAGATVEVVAVWELAKRRRADQEAVRQKRISGFWERSGPKPSAPRPNGHDLAAATPDVPQALVVE